MWCSPVRSERQKRRLVCGNRWSGPRLTHSISFSTQRCRSLRERSVEGEVDSPIALDQPNGGMVDRVRRKPSEQASTPETNRIEIAGHIAQT